MYPPVGDSYDAFVEQMTQAVDDRGWSHAGLFGYVFDGGRLRLGGEIKDGFTQRGYGTGFRFAPAAAVIAFAARLRRFFAKVFEH